MILDILKGFLIGLCASAPLGPMAILVMQKSLSEGHRSGFLTGLGATCTDTFYSIVAIFALAVAEKFIGDHQVLIKVAGGIVIILLGVVMIFKDPFRKMKDQNVPSYSIKDFLQAIVTGISNPGAILVILFLFATFGLAPEEKDLSVAPVILAFSGGSATYWFFFSLFFSRIRKNFKLSTILWIGRISGAIILVVGMALLADGLMKTIFQ